MKPFYTSKVFWFNVLTVVVAVAAYFGFGNFNPDGNAVELGAVIVAVINIILRFMTTQPIG